MISCSDWSLFLPGPTWPVSMKMEDLQRCRSESHSYSTLWPKIYPVVSCTGVLYFFRVSNAVGNKNPTITLVYTLSHKTSRDFEKSAALFQWSYLKGIIHSLPSLQANCRKNQHTTGHSHQSSALKAGGVWKSWNQHIHRSGPDLDSPFKNAKGLGTEPQDEPYILDFIVFKECCVENRNPIHGGMEQGSIAAHEFTHDLRNRSPCGNSQSHDTKLG